MRKGTHHIQKSKDKMSKAHTGVSLSIEHRRSMSISHTGGSSGMKGKAPWNKGMVGIQLCTQNVRNKISKANMGHIVSQDTRDKMSKANTGCSSIMKGIPREQTTKDKISIKAIKRWQDEEYAKKIMINLFRANQIRPNKPEKKVIGILKALSSDIKYVGDGSHWVLNTGKNPDFINEEKKQIIEVFGCYWHGCKKCGYYDKKRQRKDVSRINRFKKLGYSALVIWEHELRISKLVMTKIQEFNMGE